MVDDLGPKIAEHLLERLIPNIAFVELGLGVQIGRIAGGQVVDNRHLVPSTEEPIDDVRANETRATGNENTHVEDTNE